MNESVQAHVRISGTVQGVYFRVSTQEKAQQLGVTGWVKNNDDGRVEAVFEGEREAVDALLDWCAEGPANAVVASVEVTFVDPEGYTEFRIIR